MKKVLCSFVVLTALSSGGAVMDDGGFCSYITAKAYAAYADTTAYVYQGRDTAAARPYLRMAINVVDDDNTVYTFEYRMWPHSCDNAYRVYGEQEWRYWPEPEEHKELTHLESLASIGLRAVWGEYEKRS